MSKDKQIWCVLLFSLVEIGGQGSKQEVLAHIQQNRYWKFNDSNDTHPPKRPTELKWRNNFSYGRQHMVAQGYMDNTQRDLWSINDNGRIFLETLKVDALNVVNLATVDFTPIFQSQLRAFSFHNTDELADFALVEQLSAELAATDNISSSISLVNSPQPKGPSTIRPGNKRVYTRDISVARNALQRANYRCEIDNSHPSFLRRNSSQLYMEPHHLIPMAMTDDFDVNLDREQNIICLCSNCHNQIHYGAKNDVRQMLDILLQTRKQELSAVIGRNIDRTELYTIYKV